MTATDERPGIAEQYAGAIESSNLKMKTDTRGSVDIIIAMGWSGDGIGALLSRLRAEFDRVHGEHQLAARNLRNAEAVAAKVKAAAKATKSERLADIAQHVSDIAEKEALTARALILIHLKTLGEAKDALGALAIVEATKQKFLQRDEVAVLLAGQCLDVWLDPTCPPCQGRGYDGGGRFEQSGPPIPCRYCRQSGSRTFTVGRDDEQRRFAGYLLGRMAEAVTNAERGTQRRLRNA